MNILNLIKGGEPDCSKCTLGWDQAPTPTVDDWDCGCIAGKDMETTELICCFPKTLKKSVANRAQKREEEFWSKLGNIIEESES